MWLSTSEPISAMLYINQQVDFLDAILETSGCTCDARDREYSTEKHYNIKLLESSPNSGLSCRFFNLNQDMSVSGFNEP